MLLRNALSIIFLLVSSLPAFAQGLHGWFVVETTSKEGATKSSIVHLTPPGPMSGHGAVRNVQGLTRAPERLAWSQGTVYILMPPERVEPAHVERRVYSITAVPGLVAGWEYIPADRPQTLAKLDGEWGARELEVEGFAASDDAPVVLMRRGPSPSAERLLLKLQGTEWVRRKLPWESGVIDAPGESDRCHLVTSGASFGILVEREGKADWCVAQPSVADNQLTWTSQQLVSSPPQPPGDGVKQQFASIERNVVRISVKDQDVTLSILRPSDEYTVTTLNKVGPSVRIAPVEGSPGFVAILSGNPSLPEGTSDRGRTGETAPKAASAYQIIEITLSNRILYQGPVKQGGPVSLREIQFLSALLIILMGAVIMFVLRPERRGTKPLVLPKGIAPAETSRRIMATLVDVVASWVVASMVVRLDLTDLARPEVVFATLRGWMALGCTFAVLLASGVLLEWQFGMTIGKMLLGCRVIALPPPTTEGGATETTAEQPERVIRPGVSLVSSLIRNLSKWSPWNVAEFLATGRPRSWADRVSKSVVVVVNAPAGDQGGS